jgi:hypothetical protein
MREENERPFLRNDDRSGPVSESAIKPRRASRDSSRVRLAQEFHQVSVVGLSPFFFCVADCLVNPVAQALKDGSPFPLLGLMRFGQFFTFVGNGHGM